MSNFLDPDNSMSFIRGTSNTLRLTIRDPEVMNTSEEDPFTGSRLILTGVQIYFSVKKYLTDRSPLIQKTTALASEIAITAERAGEAEIYLLPADTVHLDLGNYTYDIWVVLPNGKKHCVVFPSTLEITGSVTRLL